MRRFFSQRIVSALNRGRRLIRKPAIVTLAVLNGIVWLGFCAVEMMIRHESQDMWSTMFGDCSGCTYLRCIALFVIGVAAVLLPVFVIAATTAWISERTAA